MEEHISASYLFLIVYQKLIFVGMKKYLRRKIINIWEKLLIFKVSKILQLFKILQQKFYHSVRIIGTDSSSVLVHPTSFKPELLRIGRQGFH